MLGIYSKFVLLLMISLATSACVSTPETIVCPHRDWFEVGRQDGTLGKDFQELFNYQKQCANSKNRPDPILYTNGRNAGLIEYCSPQNALEAGRLGQKYHEVCPEYLEQEFLDYFTKGQKIFTLQKDNANIDSKVRGLFSRLTRQVLDSESRLVLEKEIKSLKQKRASNVNEIQKIEKEVTTDTF